MKRPRPALVLALALVALAAHAPAPAGAAPPPPGPPAAAGARPSPAAAGASGAAAPSPAAPAAAGEAARTHFARGVALFQEGEHNAALVEFRRAYGALPNFRVQYNIARTCLELKDEACALGAFERYLSEGAWQIARARRAEVDRDLGRLRLRVGYVDVSVSAPGADVSIDDVPVGASPLPGPLPVGAGRHRVAASVPAGPSTYRFVEIAGGERLRVELSLPAPPTSEPARALAPPAPAAPPVAPPAPRARTALWVGLGVTSALAAGAGAFGYLAYREHDELERALQSPSAGADQIDPHRDRGRTFSLLADVSTAAALAAGAVTLYVALRPEQGKSPPAASHGGLKLQAGVRGVSAHYSF